MRKTSDSTKPTKNSKLDIASISFILLVLSWPAFWINLGQLAACILHQLDIKTKLNPLKFETKRPEGDLSRDDIKSLADNSVASPCLKHFISYLLEVILKSFNVLLKAINFVVQLALVGIKVLRIAFLLLDALLQLLSGEESVAMER